MFFREKKKSVCVHCAVSGITYACADYLNIVVVINSIVLLARFLVVSVVDGGGETPGPFPNPVS